MVAPKRKRPLHSFTMDRDLLRGLDELREKEGVSASAAVRIAVRDYLRKKGIKLKAVK